MLRVKQIDWGWNPFPLGVGALPSDFKEPYVHYFRFDENRTHADFVDGDSRRIPLAPSIRDRGTSLPCYEPEGETNAAQSMGRRSDRD